MTVDAAGTVMIDVEGTSVAVQCYDAGTGGGPAIVLCLGGALLFSLLFAPETGLVPRICARLRPAGRVRYTTD